MLFLLYVFTVTVLVKCDSLIVSPECGPKCIPILSNSTEFLTFYNVNGSPISIINKNESQFKLICNNNDIDYIYLPKYNASNVYKKVLYSDCTFPANIINLVNNHIHVLSEYLILEKWMPKQIVNFPNIKGLKVIDIKYSNMTEMKSNLITEIEDLIEFHFTNGNVTIREDFKLPKSLKILNLSNNYIEEVPQLIQNNSALEMFILSKNNLRRMPNLIRNTQLTVLDISFNKLTEIETNFIGNCTRLKILLLNNNKIKEIREEHFRSLNLSELYLQYNDIKVLPKYIFNDLPRLQILNISHNKLHTIEKFAFPGTDGNLYSLDLSYNELSSNDLCSFEGSRLNGLWNLTYLSLAHNQLEMVCSSWTLLEKLTYIDLSYNNIVNVTEDEFLFARPNVTVDFKNNQIVSILFEKSQMDFENRKYYLSDNKFICDGFLSWFIKAATDYNLFEKNIEDVKCVEPKHFENRTLSSLDYKELVHVIECEQININLANCTCISYNIENQLTLNCSHMKDPPIESYVTPNLVDKVVLILEHCSLTKFPEYFPKNLTELHLAYNNISNVPELPAKLMHLDLSNNNLSYLTAVEAQRLFVPKLNRTLGLAHNAFPCDCNNNHFLTTLIEYSYLVLDMGGVSCASGGVVWGGAACGGRGGVVLGALVLATLLTLLATLAALYYHYRVGIKATLYTYGCFLPFLYIEDVEREKQYDAFVSFAHGDHAFVIEQLLPKLEQHYHYKLCVHHRDWDIGPDIPSQILNSVENSRRTIVILSKNFLKSTWSLAEFRAGIAETYRTGFRRLIIVKLPDADLSGVNEELVTYFKSNTVIERTDPFFWQKLCFYMPHKRYKKTPEPLPLSKREEKKRMKRVAPIAEFVDKEFSKLDNVNENKVCDIKDEEVEVKE